MLCAIWYHLYNLKNLKNTDGGVKPATLLKVTLLHRCFSRFFNLYKWYQIAQQPATLLKVTLLHRCFSRFLNCTNDTISRKASHIVKEYLQTVKGYQKYCNIGAIPSSSNLSKMYFGVFSCFFKSSPNKDIQQNLKATLLKKIVEVLFFVLYIICCFTER